MTPFNKSDNPEENNSQKDRRYITESVSIPKPEFASRLLEYLRQFWIYDFEKILYILSNADALLINERTNYHIDTD